MTRFEDRHRELRKATTEGWRAYHGDEPVEMTEEWVPVAAQALDAFEARTGPLVDDLVAAHRRLVALLQDSTSNPAVTFSGVDLVQWAIRLGAAVSDSEIALAALDEASGG